MTFETVVSQMFQHIPKVREKYTSEFDYMADEEPLAYLAFSSLRDLLEENSRAKHRESYAPKAEQHQSLGQRPRTARSAGGPSGRTPIPFGAPSLAIQSHLELP